MRIMERRAFDGEHRRWILGVIKIVKPESAVFYSGFSKWSELPLAIREYLVALKLRVPNV